MHALRPIIRLATVLVACALGAASARAASGDALDLLGRGQDAYRVGDLVQATQIWTEAARLCRLEGDPAREADALARRGEAEQALGHVRKALADLGTALALAEASGDESRIASASGALGNAYFLAREPAKARPLLERSRALAAKRGDAGVLAATLNNLGNLQAAEDEAAAVETYAAAAATADRVGDRALAATARTNAARLRLAAAEWPATQALLVRAYADLRPLPASRAKAFGLASLGRVASELARREDTPEHLSLAYSALRDAADASEAIGDPRATSFAYGLLGTLYEQHRDPDSAETLSGRALFAAQTAQAPDLAYRWEWQIGRLRRARGDLDGALESYRRAVQQLQAVRQDIPVEYRDGRSSFRETLGPLFFGLADLLLQRTARMGDGAPKQVLLGEARDTVELVKVAELQDYFKDDCFANAQRQASIESIGTRTAAIYPIILPDRIELLLSFPDQRRQITVPVRQDRLTREVSRFRLQLEQFNTRTYTTSARQLYDWLVRPVLPELESRGVDTLVFVPDGPLRTIPMAALMDGDRFLVERYAIAVTPGLNLVEPHTMPRRNMRVMVAGLTEGVQGFPALPAVATEIADIRRTFANAVVLEDQTFKLNTVERDLETQPFTIVHVASHGEFSGDPDQSFVLTYDSKLTINRLEEVLKYGQYRDEPLELLTLSACKTAAGDDRAALGLAGVAVKAGARSALASLWPISDDATAVLVPTFYGALSQPENSKAQALRTAQLALVNGGQFSHPAFWAPFLLIGNWL